MSVDTPTGEGVERPPQFACGICGESGNAGEGRFLATYASDDAVTLSPTEPDGLLALCTDCTTEVTELTDAWTDVGRPPVGEADTIAGGYAAAAGACSFCDGAVDGRLLGVDVWERPGSAPANAVDDHDNYALCGSCVAIFAEFLDGITAE
jgi:hypothetical protein